MPFFLFTVQQFSYTTKTSSLLPGADLDKDKNDFKVNTT